MSGISWAICKSAPWPRQPRQHPTIQFLQAGCPFCRPTSNVKHWRSQVTWEKFAAGKHFRLCVNVTRRNKGASGYRKLAWIWNCKLIIYACVFCAGQVLCVNSVLHWLAQPDMSTLYCTEHSFILCDKKKPKSQQPFSSRVHRRNTGIPSLQSRSTVACR